MGLNQNAKNLTAGLFTLLFVVSFLNNELLSSKSANSTISKFQANLSSRLPASANTIDWEAELIKKYTAGLKDQKNLIVGRRPDTFDKFTFGTLNGSYAIGFIGGKIDSLTFNQASKAAIPQAIEDTHVFLVKNKDILSVDFSSVAKTNERRDSQGILEEYSLFNANQEKIATAEILSDPSHHLLSLRLARDSNAFASN